MTEAVAGPDERPAARPVSHSSVVPEPPVTDRVMLPTTPKQTLGGLDEALDGGTGQRVHGQQRGRD